MSNRNSGGQSIHDQVIAEVAAAQQDFEALTNPGQEHNWSIRVGQEKVYPDLLLCQRPTRTVAHLIEVETEDSVTEAESDQWAVYSRGPGRFWLLVPSASLTVARRICQRRGIAANFGRWWMDGWTIRFEWMTAAAA
jgi:hypothetical protein